MTISSEINKSGPYEGNGVSTQFDFNFKIEQAAHLHVIRTSLDGVETVLAENNYQVSLDADRTGSITLSESLPTGEKITLLLNPPFTQLVDLPNQGAWNPEVLESALDKLTSCLLKLREEVSRAVKIKASSDLADLDDLLADIEALADVASDVKSLAVVKSDIAACAANIAAILSADEEASNAASSAQSAANLRDEVANMKQLVETAKDEAIAARDAAQAANPISASDKGRELVGKETASEMRDVLGVVSGVPVGSMIDWPADAVPAFWARADGATYSRATYSKLHDALAPELTVAITSGSAVVTGIGSTQGFKTGMAIEGAEIPTGTTVQSVDGANQITLSVNATANGTRCRVYRYGNGDGSSTFNLPNFAGRVSRAWDPSSAINPDEAALGVSQEDAMQGHWHKKYSAAYNQASTGGSAFGAEHLTSNTAVGPDNAVREAISDGTHGQPRISSETRSKALTVNKIIKVFGGVDDPAVLAAGSALADIANSLTTAQSAKAKADELERVAKNKVANVTNVIAWYRAPAWTATEGIEVAVLTTTITDVAVGNKVQGTVHIFCEGENNIGLYITRNGEELIRGTGGGNNGANTYVVNAYDTQDANTPSLLSFNIFDENPDAGENVYRIMAQQSHATPAIICINRPSNASTGINAEYGVSSVILEEVLG